MGKTWKTYPNLWQALYEDSTKNKQNNQRKKNTSYFISYVVSEKGHQVVNFETVKNIKRRYSNADSPEAFRQRNRNRNTDAYEWGGRF